MSQALGAGGSLPELLNSATEASHCADDRYRNGHGCVPVNLHLQKRAGVLGVSSHQWVSH